MKREKISISVGERKQSGALFTPQYIGQQAVGAALFLHEFGYDRGQHEEIAEEVTRNVGLACLALDLAGHGEDKTEGDKKGFTILDQLQGAYQAYDYLKKVKMDGHKSIDPNRLGVAGASFGAYIAVRLSQERPCQSLLLRAPAAYPDDFDELLHEDYARGAHTNDETGENSIPKREQLEGFRLNPERLAASRGMKAIQQFGGLITVVHSEFDNRITQEVIYSYISHAQNYRLLYMKNAEHMLDYAGQKEFTKIALEWAANL